MPPGRGDEFSQVFPGEVSQLDPHPDEGRSAPHLFDRSRLAGDGYLSRAVVDMQHGVLGILENGEDLTVHAEGGQSEVGVFFDLG